MTKNPTVGEVLTQRAMALDRENGDVFEILGINQDGTMETLALGCTQHGRVLIESWQAVSGEIPSKEVIAVLNELGRASVATIRTMVVALSRTVAMELGDGHGLLAAPVVEAFVQIALTEYAAASQRHTGAHQASLERLGPMVPLLLATAREFGAASHRAAIASEPAVDSSVTGTNGAMHVTTAETEVDFDQRMAMTRAMGMAAMGRHDGDA